MTLRPLQPSQVPTPEDVQTAIFTARALRGDEGCASVVATEFGSHPDHASRRMQWVLTTLGHGSGDGDTLTLPRRKQSIAAVTRHHG